MLPALGKTLPALETHRADFRSGPSCDDQRQNDRSDDNDTADPGARSYRCSVARQLGRLQRAQQATVPIVGLVSGRSFHRADPNLRII
jgi:hypothetical protein